jgi:hypothetical protein
VRSSSQQMRSSTTGAHGERISHVALLLAFSSKICLDHVKHCNAHIVALKVHSRLEHATHSMKHNANISFYLSGVHIEVFANSTPIAATHTLNNAKVHCNPHTTTAGCTTGIP